MEPVQAGRLRPLMQTRCLRSLMQAKMPAAPDADKDVGAAQAKACDL